MALGYSVAEPVWLRNVGAMQPNVGESQELATSYFTQDEEKLGKGGQKKEEPSVDDFWAAPSIPTRLL